MVDVRETALGVLRRIPAGRDIFSNREKDAADFLELKHGEFTQEELVKRWKAGRQEGVRQRRAFRP